MTMGAKPCGKQVPNNRKGAKAKHPHCQLCSLVLLQVQGTTQCYSLFQALRPNMLYMGPVIELSARAWLMPCCSPTILSCSWAHRSAAMTQREAMSWTDFHPQGLQLCGDPWGNEQHTRGAPGRFIQSLDRPCCTKKCEGRVTVESAISLGSCSDPPEQEIMFQSWLSST